MAITKSELLETLGVFRELHNAEISAAYVAKDGAKVLSTNDFTDALKTKLENLNDEEITREDLQREVFGGASGV